MRRGATKSPVGFRLTMGSASHDIRVRELQGYSVTLDVAEALPRLGLTKVGFDALMEAHGWFCSTRDGSSDTYYDLGAEPYLYLDPHAPRTDGAVERRITAAYGDFQTV